MTSRQRRPLGPRLRPHRSAEGSCGRNEHHPAAGTARSGGGNISLTTEPPVEARLADATAPALVVRGEQDPDFPDPRAEADWIGQALRGQVVMVSEAGPYPQSQRPGLTAAAVLRFPGTVKGRG